MLKKFEVEANRKPELDEIAIPYFGVTAREASGIRPASLAAPIPPFAPLMLLVNNVRIKRLYILLFKLLDFMGIQPLLFPLCFEVVVG